MNISSISDQEFARFQKLLYDVAGIQLSAAKKPLLCGRLAKRLREFGLDSYGEYFELLGSKREPKELQVAVDLLTTNETYFFREPKHFDFLRKWASERRGKTVRVWSAACSSGEEPYTIAMVLADVLGDGPWEILASDLSTRVLERAAKGQYDMQRISGIPKASLSRYCLRGTGPQEGTLMVARELRQRVQFRHINLNQPLPQVGEFDLIFLRNVMIYFDADMKRRVVGALSNHLKSGGYLIIGHSESLNGITTALHAEMPTLYRKS
jgi:chemotaxis protein methyltransferase CheR